MNLIFLSVIFGYFSAAKIFHALTYDQRKSDGDCFTLDQVIKHISLIKNYTDIIHSSGISHCKQAEMIIKALGKDAEERLYLSIDFENDADFNKEMDSIKKIHEKYGLDKYVKAIIVGNYPVSRNISNAENLIAKINTVFEFLVKKGLHGINVTVSDNWDNFDRRIISSVDYIMFSPFPYRLNIDYKNATEFIFGKLKDIKNSSSGKDVVFGQIGWPTSDEAKAYKGASIENNKSFMKEFVAKSNIEGIDYIWYSSIDSLYNAKYTNELLEESYDIPQSGRIAPINKKIESNLLMKRSNQDQISSKSEKNTKLNKNSKTQKNTELLKNSKTQKSTKSSISFNDTDSSSKKVDGQSEFSRAKTQSNFNDYGDEKSNEKDDNFNSEISQDTNQSENENNEDIRDEEDENFDFEDDLSKESNENEIGKIIEKEENKDFDNELRENNASESVREYPFIEAQQASGNFQEAIYIPHSGNGMQIGDLIKTNKEKYPKNEQDSKNIKLEMGPTPFKINTSSNSIPALQSNDPSTYSDSKYSYRDGLNYNLNYRDRKTPSITTTNTNYNFSGGSGYNTKYIDKNNDNNKLGVCSYSKNIYSDGFNTFPGYDNDRIKKIPTFIESNLNNGHSDEASQKANEQQNIIIEVVVKNSSKGKTDSDFIGYEDDAKATDESEDTEDKEDNEDTEDYDKDDKDDEDDEDDKDDKDDEDDEDDKDDKDDEDDDITDHKTLKNPKPTGKKYMKDRKIVDTNKKKKLNNSNQELGKKKKFICNKYDECDERKKSKKSNVKIGHKEILKNSDNSDFPNFSSKKSGKKAINKQLYISKDKPQGKKNDLEGDENTKNLNNSKSEILPEYENKYSYHNQSQYNFKIHNSSNNQPKHWQKIQYLDQKQAQNQNPYQNESQKIYISQNPYQKESQRKYISQNPYQNQSQYRYQIHYNYPAKNQYNYQRLYPYKYQSRYNYPDPNQYNFQSKYS
ncbi:putative glucan endo-1,3-beta-glucosidase btgC [Smittium culicis]|uniref:glucan endo-1,3-beta-D-glucosidase n=1 Tax=Smittium culicis TaxID=133412 RepID=A0A1R1X9K3_9FUNG|nr:putative glucan endo-1,3-beta-glucosidase btgC [Smittium culicis]OMJ23490.1 putative glucan endo-1,3-beta-glucosidase btgC [Smittium culicis]